MIKIRSLPLALFVLATGLPLGAQTAAPAAKTKAPDNQTGTTNGATMQPADTPAASSNDQTQDNSVYVLSPFTVSTTRDTGYISNETLAGTRIRTQLSDVAASISIYNKQFLDDVGATDNLTLLQYTSNAQVSGTEGTYLGPSQESELIAPQGANRTRGLAAADNTRNFDITDIPWDGYNISRVAILRGPNSILYGLGSPAGIVNTTLNEAQMRDFGSLTARTGSYGSNRVSLDVNKQILKDELAIRLDAMWKDQKYEQKPAYEKAKRLYGTVTFNPNLFHNPAFKTSIKVNFEHGETNSDHPRVTPPSDSITPWFRPTTVSASNPYSGAGMTVINNPYDAENSSTGVTNSGSVNYNPWISGRGNQQEPMYYIDGATNQVYSVLGGYINNGWLNSDGTKRSQSDGAIGLRYSGTFYGLNNLASVANDLKLPGYQYGGYKRQSLQDPSVFDFYHKLIDGPTKSEWNKWNAYNVDISQTGWNNRVGIDFTYDRQRFTRGGQSLLGWDPTLSLDILKNFSDYVNTPGANGTTSQTNPNFGRPYVEGGGGGSGSSYTSDRKDYRLSLLGELRASDFLHNDFLVKLLGKHVFNVVGTDDKYFNESRSWQMYANSSDWGKFVQYNVIDDRQPDAIIYLGPSIIGNGQTSATGANIPGVTAPVTLPNGGVEIFNSQWNSNVSPAANWDVPTNLQIAYDGMPAPGSTTQLTQASNPANYVGWSTIQNNLMRYNNGADTSLITHAQKQLRETKSLSSSYQGYFWNHALVLTLGWRYDKVSTQNAVASKVNANRDIYNLDPSVYNLDSNPPSVRKAHSTSGGLILHLNKLFRHDPLPINVSLGYDKSSNFQVVSVHKDVYGNVIPDPSGQNKEYSLQLATKDNKYVLKVVKYDTKVFNGSSTLNSSYLLGAIVANGLNWRNVFLYQLGGYTWDTRNTDSYRNRWTNAYPNLTATEAQQQEDAAISTWNDIQKHLEGTGFFKYWNFTPTTSSVLTDRTTYLSDPAKYAPNPSTLTPYSVGYSPPPGFQVTSDAESKGYEFEFDANPLPNWHLTFNASRTEAIQTNLGGKVLSQYINYISSKLVNADGTPTPAGLLPRWGGAGNAMYNSIWAHFLGDYNLLLAQQGADVPEIRKWQYKLVTNYNFIHGMLKGFGVGGGYRWYDKVAIGYPTKADGSYDMNHPYYGPTLKYVDLWVSYKRKLTDKIDWKIQLNVRNVGKHDGLIPVSTEPNGDWATVRLAPVQEWFLTNTFSF